MMIPTLKMAGATVMVIIPLVNTVRSAQLPSTATVMTAMPMARTLATRVSTTTTVSSTGTTTGPTWSTTPATTLSESFADRSLETTETSTNRPGRF